MPKTVIDYSNTIIYKITCIDPSITDVYVGHTTNFVQRKHAHKQCCINEKSNNCKLYKTIRANGGWDNWVMEIVAFFKCNDHYEARIKEQEYFVLLNATLNSIEPLPKPKTIEPKQIIEKKTYFCETCNVTLQNSRLFEVHNNTQKHLKNSKFEIFVQDPPKFHCNICNIKTNNKKDYDKHMLTAKHIKLTSVNTQLTGKPPNIFICENCNKKYKSRVGLWKHHKLCKSTVCHDNEILQINESSEIQELKEFMKYLMKENSDMKTMMMKVLENGTVSNSYNNTTNSHNKAFNLNFFLNETCKDAMNIMDFVESIKLQVSDLERVGEVGYVEGISDIIVSNLNKLDVTQRPIHCTDKKRETIYIKDAGKWEKDENTNLIRKAIRKVTHNNQRLLPQFKEKYPDYHNYYSSHSDKVTKVVVETMVNNIPEKEEKIIRNIAKSVVLDKAISL